MREKGQLFLTEALQLINMEGKKQKNHHQANTTIIFSDKILGWMLKLVSENLRRTRISVQPQIISPKMFTNYEEINKWTPS